MRKTNAKRFTSLSEIEIEIGVNVQRDSIAIPPPNHSQSIRNCWFVISFTHVHTTNAKRLKPLSEGMFKEIEIRIGVYVQRDSIAIPSYNYSQSITNYLFVVLFTHVLTTNAKRFKPLSEGVHGKGKNIFFRYREMITIFHPLTIVKVLGIVSLSFRFPMCVKQMQNGSHPCRKLKLR